MKKILLLVLGVLGGAAIYAQTWDGGGDNTSWHDALNWSGDVIPAAGVVVTFPANTTATITGTVANNPARLTVQGNCTITFDLDITVNGAAVPEHSLTVGNGSTVTLGATGNSRVINFITNTSNRGGITLLSSSSNPTVIIAGSTTLNIQAQNGINMQSTTGTVTNNGTINMTSIGTDGILLPAGGTFNNNGTVTISSPGSDGVDNLGTVNNNSTGIITINTANTYGVNNKVTTGVFNNSGTLTVTGNNTNPSLDGIYSENSITNSGTITVTAPSDDCIQINLGTLTNSGAINVTTKSTASSTNAGIEIATATTVTNSAGGSITVSGGGSATARNIIVVGTLDNYGTITTSNGNPGIGVRNDGGTITNYSCAIIATTGARISNSAGTLVNNGYIKEGSSTQNMFNGTSGVATNNAFYYTAFLTGVWPTSNGSVDNGVLFQITTTKDYDLNSTCTVDFNAAKPDAMAAFTWSYSPSSLGSNAANGQLTFSNVFPNQAGPHTITTQCADYAAEFTISVSDICAVMPVELVSFDAKNTEKYVELAWQTATERNTRAFEIERSPNGVSSWNKIGSVAAAGETLTPQEYGFIDHQPLDKAVYRLKIVDFDGREEYSPAVNVTRKSRTQIRLAPNPVSDYLKMDWNADAEESLSVVIVDAQGRTVRSLQFEQQKGSNQLRIDLADLQAGRYSVQLGNGEIGTFVKY